MPATMPRERLLPQFALAVAVLSECSGREIEDILAGLVRSEVLLPPSSERMVELTTRLAHQMRAVIAEARRDMHALADELGVAIAEASDWHARAFRELLDDDWKPSPQDLD